MTLDVTPELLDKVKKVFSEKTETNMHIRMFMKKINEQTAAALDVQQYSRLLGELLADALLEILTEDALPNGKMYWNIADRVIRPMINQNYDLVNMRAAEVQKIIDTANKTGLNAVHAALPKERIDGLMNTIAAPASDFSVVQTRLDEPIVNITESFYDDFVRENAKFRYEAGLEPRIIRIATGSKTCQWCQNLAGTYKYSDAKEKKDVWRRHENCHCMVYFENKAANYYELTAVHSKRTIRDQNQVNERVLANLDSIPKKMKGKS